MFTQLILARVFLPYEAPHKINTASKNPPFIKLIKKGLPTLLFFEIIFLLQFFQCRLFDLMSL